MTGNQINYRNYVESVRHNSTVEDISKDSNRITESLGKESNRIRNRMANVAVANTVISAVKAPSEIFSNVGKGVTGVVKAAGLFV